jgi:uncharacterized protein (TIGR02231 family)
MRNYILKTLFVLASLSTSFVSQAKEIIAPSKIKTATVFLRGVNIERTSDIQLNKGSHELVFKGISTNISANSIQVQSTKYVTLLGINHEIRYKEDFNTPKKIKVLQDSLKLLQVQKTSELNVKEAYQAELNMILTNQSIKGNQTLSIDDIREFSALYRQLIPEIKSKILIADLLIEKLDKSINRINSQLRKHQSKTRERESVITVKVDVSHSHKGKVALSYYSRDAYWTPEYDLRAESVEADVNLTYKANIVQNTGNDWKNIELNLSTGNPSLNGTVSELSTWRLNYYRNLRIRKHFKSKRSALPSFGYSDNVYNERLTEDEDNEVAEVLSNFNSDLSNADLSESGTNYNFKIKTPYDIPSQGKATSVEIKRMNIKSSFRYFAVPKKNDDAFLMARFTDWGGMNLIPGNSSIYFEGNYVGKSFIDPHGANDTLRVSMGRDKNIFIKREKVKDECQNVLVTNAKKHTVEYKTTVKNQRKEAVEIKVQDQIPVSKIKEMIVSFENLSNADYDEKTGILTWKIKLAAGETKEIGFVYSVKYPKNKVVVLE